MRTHHVLRAFQEYMLLIEGIDEASEYSHYYSFLISSQPWWGFTSSLLVQTEVELGACRGTCVCKPQYITPVETDTAHKHHCLLVLSHSFLLPASPKPSFKRSSLSILLKGAWLRTCQPSIIYPPTGDARSTVSRLAEEVIKRLYTSLKGWGDVNRTSQLNNRPLSSTLQPAKSGSTLGCRFRPSGNIRRIFLSGFYS